MRRSLGQRIATRTNFSGPCWEWTGARDGCGYGHIKIDGKVERVHRVVFESHHGPIPTGMKICHRCDNPSCLRPTHLFLGTHADNMSDMKAKGRARSFRGSASRRARWDEKTIAIIKRRLLNGEVPNRLNAEYGMGNSSIYSIKSGRTWNHVAPASMAELQHMEGR
jgi:hypothetical protein